MRIIHVASELAPVAKVGGLADVLLGLCRELSTQGQDVDIILPKYDCIDSDTVRDLTVETSELLSYYEGENHRNTVWTGWVGDHLKVYFIEPHHPRHFFRRGCFYGCHDDTERFLYFCRAALEFIFKKQTKPFVLHLHDWQTAAIAALYSDLYRSLGIAPAKIVYTIHNLEYQGQCSIADFSKIGLNGSKYAVFDRLQDPTYYDTLNMMKGGIVYSDYVTTVSPTYANEVKTKQNGCGLDGVLRYYDNKFTGILNGIDKEYWNPETDRYLPTHFSMRELPRDKHDHDTLDKKGFLKKLLREKLGLNEEHAPIVACVARLVPQKGTHMIQQAIPAILEHGGQFILLGTSPIPSITEEFQQLAKTYFSNSFVSINLQYSEELAHLIYAGSDLIFVPSIFEPCGLTQMIALGYGTLPVVRKTGGLADTVFDFDDATIPYEKRNGFTFIDPTKEAANGCLIRAISHWFKDQDSWLHWMRHGMAQDFSWKEPAQKYLGIYQTLAARA
jgi:starch synthase